MSSLSFQMCLLIFLFLNIPSLAADTIRNISFKGYLASQPRVVKFTGVEILSKKGRLSTKTTVYKGLNSKDLFSDRCVFDSKEFSLELLQVVNNVDGSQLEMQKIKGPSKKYAIRKFDISKSNPNLKSDESTVIKEFFIVPKIIHEYVEKNWKQLRKDKKIPIKLFLPSKNKKINLVLVLSSLPSGDYVVSMSSNSWVVRQFLPDIKFTFEKDKVAKVKRYQGPSAFSINGSKPEIIIDFSYQ